MEEVPWARKRSKSEADLFMFRFEGKIHRIGKGGLMELFFSKNRPNSEGSSNLRRKVHSSTESRSIKPNGSLSLPKISKTETQILKEKKGWQNCKYSGVLGHKQKQKLKIQDSKIRRT